jgi:hypothetical protein
MSSKASGGRDPDPEVEHLRAWLRAHVMSRTTRLTEAEARQMVELAYAELDAFRRSRPAGGSASITDDSSSE